MDKTKEKTIVSIFLILFMLVGLIGVLLINKRFIEPFPESVMEQPQAKVSMAEDLFTEKETIQSTVYAYTSSYEETDEDPFTMANGETVFDGAVACPIKYDFGQQVKIQGVIYTCSDRMNARYRDGNNFDIWMKTKDEAYAWGVKDLEVIILK